jgi:hypothetical protein
MIDSFEDYSESIARRDKPVERNASELLIRIYIITTIDERFATCNAGVLSLAIVQ